MIVYDFDSITGRLAHNYDEASVSLFAAVKLLMLLGQLIETLLVFVDFSLDLFHIQVRCTAHAALFGPVFKI